MGRTALVARMALDLRPAIGSWVYSRVSAGVAFMRLDPRRLQPAGHSRSAGPPTD